MKTIVALAILAAFSSAVAYAQGGQPAVPREQMRLILTAVGPNGQQIDGLGAWMPKPLAMEKAAFIGISSSPVPAALRQQLRLPNNFGLIVDQVEKGGPADAAGIRQYDVLEKLDDQLLVNAQQMAALVRSHKGGDEVKLSIVHQGQRAVVDVKLVEKNVPPLEEGNPWAVPQRFFTETNPDVPLGDFVKDWNAASDAAQKKIEVLLRNHADNNPFEQMEQHIHQKLLEGDVTVRVTMTHGQPTTLTLKDWAGNVIMQVPVEDAYRNMLPKEILSWLDKLRGPTTREGTGAGGGGR